ncbi:MAG TPA: glycosyltransferase [Candidatus Nanoarchaeia archaeon]|nr:glycosyltransferase [Candidatus Nanoarchaeia archaeon]
MKKERKIEFSLIICGYNEEKNLDSCIKSCLNQNYPKNKYEIIYVDNNSNDNSLKIAKKYPIIVFTEKKQGLSEARNCGIKNSKGEILVFLDADLKLEQNYLKFHEETFKNKQIGAGGGKVLPLIKTWISDYLGVSLFEGYPRYKSFKQISTYPGCNLSIKREVLKKVGLFRENLITSAGITRFAEDKEMCERIRKNGYKILYNPKAMVYHKNTFRFKKLIMIWIKGAKGRLNMIRLGKKDLFSSLFKFNTPLIYLFLMLVSLVLNLKIGLFLFIVPLVILIFLCIKSFFETNLKFQSFLVKPIMDSLSILIINLSIIYYRLNKSYSTFGQDQTPKLKRTSHARLSSIAINEK